MQEPELYFWLLLSLAFAKPYKQLMQEMDSEDLALYMAFYELEPWGGKRGDLQAASISRLMYQLNRGKDSPDLPQAAFLPTLREEKPQPPTKQQLINKLLAMAGPKKGK